MSGSIDLSSFLTTLYGGSSSTQTTGGALTALKVAEANSTQDIAHTAAQPQVAKDIATFRAAVASAKSPAELLRNPTVLKVLLTANGLGDQVQYTALAQKALLSDTTDSNSVADKLSDTSWKDAASTFDFATKGLSIIQTPSVLDTVANGYAEVLWRQSLDQTTPGLSDALSFRQNASKITSADQILADPTLRTVVLTALGIPQQIAYQDLQAEEQAITSRLDISHFQNPAFVEQFTQRYLIQNTIANSGTTPAVTGTASLYTSDGSSSTSSQDTLAALAVQSQGLVV